MGYAVVLRVAVVVAVRVVLPVWDQTLSTLVSCLDTTLRRIGGAPTYALYDYPKTVTVEHVAGVAIRHPDIVAAGRHYGCKMETYTTEDRATGLPVVSRIVLSPSDGCPAGAEE